MAIDKTDLRKFGIAMGSAFAAISVLIFIRQKQAPLVTAGISAAFFVFSALLPAILKPVYIFWLKLAFVLGWINTRIILSLVFYGMVTPIGLLLRLCGIDLLDRRLDKDRQSYWKEKERNAENPLDYERQF